MRVAAVLAAAFHSAKLAAFRNSVDYLVGATLSPALARRAKDCVRYADTSVHSRQ